ncbi:MAG: indole-3-glycerol phosphate synthase TrpC [Peptococcaceae bacterium]|jgi:indole-3-glycerol phosphate synthase|nr:indole-3-glycerol phosphate synthase TrpC [Peptococcaceae bacterium]
MILNRLAESARKRVEQAKQARPLSELRREALAQDCQTFFPFERALAQQEISFICELKKASPSQGVIAEHFPYLQIAREYEQAGAAAISVLTEPEYFLGNDQILREITAQVSIPVLRKDFTVDAYQIYEAKLLGAAAILLICAILDAAQLSEYITIADSLGVSCLVETHNEQEITTALQAGARVIGVNNRDLTNFQVDIHHALRLRERVPRDRLFVAESGIHTPEDIARLRKQGVNAVLIGEALMIAPDKTAMFRQLRSQV